MYLSRIQQSGFNRYFFTGGGVQQVCIWSLNTVHLACSVGGNIQAMVWDPTGERLAVQFTGTSLILYSCHVSRLLCDHVCSFEDMCSILNVFIYFNSLFIYLFYLFNLF